MNWKLVLVFLVGLGLGIPLGMNLANPFFYLGNYTLVLDSNYPDIALSLINSANSSIDLAIYSAKYYPGYSMYPNLLLDSLCKARARGVRVRVVLDDELDHNNKTIAYLRSCGVDARLDSPKTRTHAKFMIVDSRLVLLGSTNWSYSSLKKNHEVDVLINDPSFARELERYFNKLVQ